jgi:hypothetical protein
MKIYPLILQVEEAPMEGVQFLCYFFHTRVEFRLAGTRPALPLLSLDTFSDL